VAWQYDRIDRPSPTTEDLESRSFTINAANHFIIFFGALERSNPAAWLATWDVRTM